MEEDELGTMRTISPSFGPAQFIVCARCARATPAHDTVVVAADTLTSHSDYEQVCRRCYAALVEGEQDLAMNEP